MQSCFKECTRLGMQSVAFPSLGAGILQYPSAVVAKIMCEEANAYLKSSRGSLKEVKFVIFMDSTFKEFQNVLGSATTHSSLGAGVMEVPSPPVKQMVHSLHKKGLSANDQMGDVFRLQNGIQVELVCGDITEDDSEAIINSTNSAARLVGGGVAGALLKKGGATLQQMCDKAIEKEGLLQEGKVLVTKSAGSLQCSFIFHIVFESRKHSSFVRTLSACLNEAEKRGLKTIAFPAIGTGIGGYPAPEAAKGMLKAFHQFAATSPTHVNKIRVFLFQLSVYQEMVSAFKGSQSQSYDGLLTWLGYAIVKAKRAVIRNVPWTAIKSSSVDVGSAVDSLHVVPSESEIHAEIQLTIYGQSATAVEGAEQKLYQYIDKEFEWKKIEDTNINELSEMEISKLREVAASHHVIFQINKHPLNFIRLRGSKASVNDVRDEVRKVLSECEVKINKRKAAEMLAKKVQWCYYDDSSDSFELYDAEMILDIEEAYTTNKNGVFSHKSEVYGSFQIFFTRMVERSSLGETTVKRVDQAEEGNMYVGVQICTFQGVGHKLLFC